MKYTRDRKCQENKYRPVTRKQLKTSNFRLVSRTCRENRELIIYEKPCNAIECDSLCRSKILISKHIFSYYWRECFCHFQYSTRTTFIYFLLAI